MIVLETAQGAGGAEGGVDYDDVVKGRYFSKFPDFV